MAKLTGIEGGLRVEVSLPGVGGISGGLSGSWVPDDCEKSAAWEMYVELVTRVSVVELAPDEGVLREALSSLYTLFGTTREILRKHGPSVAKPKKGGELSFGQLSVFILNDVLRPFLAKWHPLLADYENSCDSSVSRLAHESAWSRNEELRQALRCVRLVLADYADCLAEVAGVPPLTPRRD